MRMVTLKAHQCHTAIIDPIKVDVDIFICNTRVFNNVKFEFVCTICTNMYHHVIITCPDYQQNCQRAIHLPSTTGVEHPLSTTEAGHLPSTTRPGHLPLELGFYHLPLSDKHLPSTTGAVNLPSTCTTTAGHLLSATGAGHTCTLVVY